MSIPEDLRGDLQGNWKEKLLRSPLTNQPKPILANALAALRQAPEWDGILGYDEFALATMALRPPPWLRHQENAWTPRHWTDSDDAQATEWLHHQHITVTLNVAQVAVSTVAQGASYHPIRTYLQTLEWDRKPRVDSFTSRYLGASDTPYHRAVGRCSLIGAVARVKQPGCKVDTMPVLEGEQGTLKSSAIEALFTPWFSDDLADMGTRDAAMQMRVAWGIEVAELASMTRSEIEKIKAFISRKEDKFRPPYGRRVLCVPRQSVMFGSTNVEAYLKDDTGARRFYPIRCGTIDLTALRADRDQLWAEAVELYSKGTRWWMEGDDAALARDEQDQRYVEDAWQAGIDNYIEDKDQVTVSQVLEYAIEKHPGNWTRADEMRVSACLKRRQWKRVRKGGTPRSWYYARGISKDGTSDEGWDA